jgi:hypothetical protein
MLDIEIELAAKDWEEIPTARIADVAAEARKQAGEFMPTNGLMAKIWREIKGQRMDEAQRAIREENTAKYLTAPGADVPSEEERARIAAEFAEIARRLAQ